MLQQYRVTPYTLSATWPRWIDWTEGWTDFNAVVRYACSICHCVFSTWTWGLFDVFSCSDLPNQCQMVYKWWKYLSNEVSGGNWTHVIVFPWGMLRTSLVGSSVPHFEFKMFARRLTQLLQKTRKGPIHIHGTSKFTRKGFLVLTSEATADAAQWPCH